MLKIGMLHSTVIQNKKNLPFKWIEKQKLRTSMQARKTK